MEKQPKHISSEQTGDGRLKKPSNAGKVLIILIGGPFFLFQLISSFRNFWERDNDAGTFQLLSAILVLIAMISFWRGKKVKEQQSE